MGAYQTVRTVMANVRRSIMYENATFCSPEEHA